MNKKLMLAACAIISTLGACGEDHRGCDYDHRMNLQIVGPDRFVWNGRIVNSRSELRKTFETAASKEPQPVIEVIPNKRVPYDTVASIMANAQKAGLRCVGVTGLDQPN
jgi:biopolymer transport protein ExbD